MCWGTHAGWAWGSNMRVLGGPRWGGAGVGSTDMGRYGQRVGTATHLLHFKQSVVNRVSYTWPSTLPSHQTLNRCSIHWRELLKEIISLNIITW